ncbi:MAG: leucyl/phenylalanyl-tRNA--protein transferase, partial [Saprospiraceae bacterium]
WFHEGQSILWWWLTPRLMVRPSEVHISHSVRNAINQKKFVVTVDQNFESVIRRCSGVHRRGQGGSTWILPEMIEAYIALFKLGYAHSIEVTQDGELVGGLYGIALGKIFFGESMFSEKSNASKVGFVFLANYLASKGFKWIDCQQDTPHMRTLGADLVDESEFLSTLKENQFYILSNSDKIF